MKRMVLALLAVAALVAGLGGGLLYTWVLAPIEEVDSAPNALRPGDKLVYLALIGDLYVYEGDRARAEDRLAELDVQADGATLAGYIEQYLDGGGRPEDVRNLAHLAEDLGASGGVLLVFESVPIQGLPTPTSPANPAASPSPRPTPTPAPSFQLADQTSVCAKAGQPGRIAVRVRDAAGGELAGVEIVVSWALGQDRFFTGLRPELGAGYADFEMKPGIEYEVALARFRGDTAQGLTSDVSPGVCPSGVLAVDWRLIFEQIP